MVFFAIKCSSLFDIWLVDKLHLVYILNLVNFADKMLKKLLSEVFLLGSER